MLIMENLQKQLLRNVYEDYESSYDELLQKASWSLWKYKDIDS